MLQRKILTVNRNMVINSTMLKLMTRENEIKFGENTGHKPHRFLI
jgi:hypothetical protein